MGKILIAFFLVGVFVLVFATKHKEMGIASPIPRVFGTLKSSSTINNWFPKKSIELGRENYNLSLSSNSAILVDYDTEEIIFSKNANLRLPVASTVKIMTALVALDVAKLTDVYTVSKNAANIGENSMGLTEGERLTLEELLYGMMLVSGNDAATTIAEGVAGGEDTFVKLMNEKVRTLGLNNTKFINASGLDEDGNGQYSTAYDLAVTSHYVWEKYPKFGEITSTYHKYIEANGGHKSFDLYNDTNLLTTYPGVRGIKPGFTWEAGLCLVTYAENSGKRLIGVILGSGDRRGEMKELLDYGFNSFGIKVSHPDLDL